MWGSLTGGHGVVWRFDKFLGDSFIYSNGDEAGGFAGINADLNFIVCGEINVIEKTLLF